MVKSKLKDGQCGFRQSRSIMDQIFTLKQILEKSWDYGKISLNALSILKKHNYDRVHRDILWKLLHANVNGQLLRAIKSFYC